MHTPHRPPRTSAILAILKFALLDLVGVVLLALGLGWFVQGPGTFFNGFPSTTADAFIASAAGLILMAYAAMRILRELKMQQDKSA